MKNKTFAYGGEGDVYKRQYQQCGHLRIDTHPDNHVMQNLLRKNGFVHCGTVYVVEDTYPRLAFEKVSSQ